MPQCDHHDDHDPVTDQPRGNRCPEPGMYRIEWDDGERCSNACAQHLAIDQSATVKPAKITPLLSAESAKARFVDMSCKYDGRVIRMQVFVNSDEPINEIVARVSRAAQGEAPNAAVVLGSEYTGDEGKKLWAALQEAAAHTAANPKAVSVDENGKPR